MTKNKFEEIKITEEALSTVTEFKAIVAPGKKRPLLNKEQHKELVLKKFKNGADADDHITLFRVLDKKDLPPKEISEYTVHGPHWTPSSSISFVTGALSNGSRVWLATEPKNDETGLLGKKGEPAIYTRELNVAVVHGWLAREARATETYGRTSRAPCEVLTPPSSPKLVSSTTLGILMDVNASWNTLTLSAENLTQRLITISVGFSDFLKKQRLTIDDFGDLFHTIDKLIRGELIPLEEIGKLPPDIIKMLLQNKEIISLLETEDIECGELIEIYNEYSDPINECRTSLEKFNLIALYNLVTNNLGEFEKILSALDLSIDEIIKLYNNNSEMFFAFANDNAIAFFQRYADDIDIEELERIYNNNEELYWALINDPEGLVGEIGVEGFIDMYKQAQHDIHEIADDNLYKGAYDPYDFVKTRIAREECPDELLDIFPEEEDDNDSNDGHYSESSDNYSNGYDYGTDYGTDEDLDLDRISLGEGSDSGEELDW